MAYFSAPLVIYILPSPCVIPIIPVGVECEGCDASGEESKDFKFEKLKVLYSGYIN
ncbi:conserved hypothetical protein [Ricinus communis]|uniref:Uncharacterized protein n=1 Tax=Ricinus communis TaxID=3988 RepID=B9RPQ8_RICCO|nr:conserved hypothetical protein [Ricinus communis]